MRRTSVSRKPEAMAPILPLPSLQKTTTGRNYRRWTNMLPRLNRPSPKRLLLMVLGLSFVVTLLVEVFHLRSKGYGSNSGISIPKPIFLMPRPRVLIAQGTYKGNIIRGSYPQTIETFLGIPYAQTTAGKNRFKPPVLLKETKQTFDASEYGPRCPSSGDSQLTESEDCLNLNIFRPHGVNNVSPLVPVAVFFHGGAFNFGNGKTRAMDNLVAWSEKPMVGVSFNYRVGALGFLSGKLAHKEGLLNVGLKDQAACMQWVRENINAFGGDPNQITIMGISAGAHSVSPTLCACACFRVLLSRMNKSHDSHQNPRDLSEKNAN